MQSSLLKLTELCVSKIAFIRKINYFRMLWECSLNNGLSNCVSSGSLKGVIARKKKKKDFTKCVFGLLKITRY